LKRLPFEGTLKQKKQRKKWNRRFKISKGAYSDSVEKKINVVMWDFLRERIV